MSTKTSYGNYLTFFASPSRNSNEKENEKKNQDGNCKTFCVTHNAISVTFQGSTFHLYTFLKLFLSLPRLLQNIIVDCCYDISFDV